jgi:hypothetical protein
MKFIQATVMLAFVSAAAGADNRLLRKAAAATEPQDETDSWSTLVKRELSLFVDRYSDESMEDHTRK